jgi:CheY-like chemotaxis protein
MPTILVVDDDADTRCNMADLFSDLLDDHPKKNGFRNTWMLVTTCGRS